ncbi:MAG: SDR family oxidoreductase [Candidatus Competibacteraceae bacterium]|nr:SDR family oxidoreductase [Candidatus Competibacteraceae bacterium]
MTNKIVLISGATSGIGLQTAIQLARLSYDIYITGRNKERAEEALSIINAARPGAAKGYFICDYASQFSIREVSQQISSSLQRLDVLINNAGAVFSRKVLTNEGIESTFAVNHLGYFLFTHCLLPIMLDNKAARIVNVSSAAHYSAKLSIPEVHNPKNYYALAAYATSKLANVLFTYKLSTLLQHKGITVNCLHPGVVKTDIGNKRTGFFIGSAWSLFTFVKGISVEKGAEPSVFLASSPQASAFSGKYIHRQTPRSSSVLSYDTFLQDALWEYSEKLTSIQQYI